MSDYIQDEKNRLEREAVREDRTEQLRLHDARVVRAKTPGFWDAVILKLKADCEECAAAFPNDGHRNPILTEKGNGFELRNVGFPAQVFVVELKIDGYFVEIMKQIQSSKYSPVESAGQEEIRIEVDSTEEIKFITQRNQSLQTPDDVAAYFISAICGFKPRI